MQHTESPTDQPLLACETCMTEIPESEADYSEAEEYVAYYCGLDCYQQWREEHKTHPLAVR